MKCLYFGVLIWVLGLAPVAAQQDGVERFLEVLNARTPGATFAQIDHNPKRFLTETAGAILGFGQDGEIGEARIEDAIRTERAAVRARQLRRLLVADLDDDLDGDSKEIALAIRSASAIMRRRLMNWHMKAVQDQDGVVRWDALPRHARVEL